MPLAPGTMLNHYTILAVLGKGGMGEVWRARDTKLGREVAIKTLPAEFARDPERIARFEREAKLLASLNHPNIAAIYGFEEDKGTHFLVMELVEGGTLAERLHRGAIPVEECLKLALQITEALEAAHERPIVHRDLKPANTKITPEGRVKVLDFGLAKAFAGEQADVSLSNSPTLSMAATQQGVILGTAAYMSPEQARGETVDKRADIWAFGCVLFEMLTGRAAFSGKTVSDILAGVLRADPEWKALPPALHPRIRFLLERCLEKEARDRYQGIADARVEIQRVLADPNGVLTQPVAGVVQVSTRSRLPWVAALVAATASIAGFAAWNLRLEVIDAPRPVSRFSYVLPEGQQFTNAARQVVAVSPDGSRMVYVANQRLFLRAMDTLESTPIPGTDESPTGPFFSPDGQWVGYFSSRDNKLKKIALTGGAAVTLCDAVNPNGAPSWGADDTIVFGQPNGIMRVSANGGTPEMLIAGSAAGNPQILPGGKYVLFQGARNEIVVQPLESGEPKVLLVGQRAQYIPTGHLIYGLEGVLFAVRFDAAKLEVVGGPVPLVEGVRTDGGPHQYAVSDSGALVYVPGSAAQRTLVWVDRNGIARPIETIPPGNYSGPRLSPDGKRVAIMADGDVWIYDMDSGRRSRVTSDGKSEIYVEWDPAGTRVAYSSRRDEESVNVWIQPSDGSGQAEQLTDLDGNVDLDSWSPDGRVLAVHHHPRQGTQDILMVPLAEANRKPEPFLVRGFVDEGSTFSPDGRYIAYVSTETGQNEVQIRPYPGPGGQVTVSVGGGSKPMWSRNGELFYRSLAGDRMMSVSVTTQPALTVGPPRVVFQERYPTAAPFKADYDVTGDGKRFLMVADGTTPAAARINIVLNWFEELKARLPVPRD